MFGVGKTLKYTSWLCIALFFYHFMLVKKYEKPEEMPTIEPFLDAAKFVSWSIYDLTLLFTRPGMSKLLPDKLSIPGQPYPKCLVLNLNGLLVHQSYNLGTGMTLYKRPGLSVFL